MNSDITLTALMHHSQTRRKACEQCVRGKRRCDLLVPRCSRCAKRRVDCEYAGVKDVLEPLQSAPFCGPARSTRSTNLTIEPLSKTFELQELLFPLNSIDSPVRVAHTPLQFNYLTTYFRISIRSLALQSRTFFIHPSFLRNLIPTPLESAISVCALSTLNSPSTFDVLDSYLKTLITSSPATFYSPSTILFSVQALIIFQTIRLLSSDERRLLHAEANFPLLNTWTIALQTAYFSLPSDSTSYKDWVLKESVRRTILTSVLLRSMYGTLRDGYTDLVPLLASLPVSSNGKFWELERNESRWEGVRKEEVSTYWEFVGAWISESASNGKSEKGEFERVLLCLEEDGKVGEAGRELISNVKFGAL
ncbi:uncharacterized protein LY89DRAFT_128046 [Mollisia scopiformis]|uniref:Zn(2)-C6 fungal-type domain-containing protein n=1 Tax=Mollisia scopiformis TaxID=149040 RepID=A0A194X4B1_MOLSC|nr:uncharacterized protein LY89DRAFT_128046 [Mollisia scopiformis]KUJ15018.1 hypothetical protein LY89DRAFT_128046 [Mollisia scopiformis]